MNIHPRIEKQTEEKLIKLKKKLKKAQKSGNKEEIFKTKMQIQKIKERIYLSKFSYNFNS